MRIRERLRTATAIAIERTVRERTRAALEEKGTQKHDRKLAELHEREAAVERAGPRSVNKAIGALRTLLKFAQSRGYVSQNVATFAKKLKAQTLLDRPLDEAVLTPLEITALLEAAEPDWRAALGVLAYAGLRLGELLGLQWGDVELDRRRILVRRQLCGQSGELREPKTKAGTRFVELPSFVISQLRTWKLRCPKGELDLCFPNRDGAASLMIAAGCDIASVSRQLGHSNVAVTLAVYSHWFQKRSDSRVVHSGCWIAV